MSDNKRILLFHISVIVVYTLFQGKIIIIFVVDIGYTFFENSWQTDMEQIQHLLRSTFFFLSLVNTCMFDLGTYKSGKWEKW
jgi:hypothetical protein